MVYLRIKEFLRILAPKTFDSGKQSLENILSSSVHHPRKKENRTGQRRTSITVPTGELWFAGDIILLEREYGGREAPEEAQRGSGCWARPRVREGGRQRGLLSGNRSLSVYSTLLSLRAILDFPPAGNLQNLLAGASGAPVSHS